MDNNKDITPSKSDLVNPIATLQSVTGLFNNTFQELPNPDNVLRKAGRHTVAEYRKLLYDSHVWALVQSRFSGLNKLEYRVLPDGVPARVRKAVEQFLAYFDMQEVYWNATNTALFGYSVTELIWAKYNDVWRCKLHFLPPEWFYVDEDLRWRMRRFDDATGLLLPKHKFVVSQHQADYVNPYGFAVLSATFWAVAFKRVGIEQWTRFASEYGLPFLVGKAPASASEKFVNEMLLSMDSMRQSGSLVLDERASVEAINVGNSQAGVLFRDIIDMANTEISKAILSETLTTEIGANGSFAAANVHKDVGKAVTETDAKIAKGFLMEVARSFVLLQFGKGAPCPEIEIYEEDDVQAERSERDLKLYSLGVRFSDEYFKLWYGLNDGEFIVDGMSTQEESETAPNSDANNTENETDEQTGKNSDEVENEQSMRQHNNDLTLLFNAAKNRRMRNVLDGDASVTSAANVGTTQIQPAVDAFIDIALRAVENSSSLRDAEQNLAALLSDNEDLSSFIALSRIAGRFLGINNG